MAILQLSSFYDLLRFNSYSFELNENIISSVDGSGQLLTSHLGPRIWKGTINCSATNHADAIEMNALLQAIQNPNVFFEVTDEVRQYPKSYKEADSAALNNVRLVSPLPGYAATITGLPVGYVLSPGDNFSFSINGVKRICRIATGGSANTGGSVSVTLLNPLPSGLVNNTVITVKKPALTARYVPGSLSTYSIDLSAGQGASFSWVQTIRV